MDQKPRVVFADPLTDEFEGRWREDLDGLPIELILLKDRAETPLREAVSHARIIITTDRSVDESLLKAAGQQLKLVVKLSRWPIDVDVEACKRRGVALRMVPRLGCISVAEHAMALLLACARKLIPGHLGVANGSYRSLGLTPAVTRERSFAFRWLPLKLFEVYGKTLGIIGLGEIGRELAVRARSFGMEVLYLKRRPLPKEFEEALEVRFCDLMEILKSSDFVSLHVPHTDQTEKMLGKTEFKAMKPTACLINTARGGVVDEKALVWALESGEIAGAGLDVFAEEPVPFDNPLLQLENVVLSPHNGGGSGTGRRVVAEEVRSIISEFIR